MSKPYPRQVQQRSPAWSHVIPAGRGFAFRLNAGQVLRITDLEGQQVTDLLAFDISDTTHRFSRAQTKKLNARVWISVGHDLYSNLCKPLLKIVGDSVGRHDMQFSPCGPEDNLLRFGQRGKRTCIENFIEVLAPYKIPHHLLCEPFGIFFNMSIDEDGICKTHYPRSQPGDSIEFEAYSDCLIALSACPQVLNGCNGYKLSPVQVDVFDAGSPSKPS
jgi:uncharacterized protein YcgI (DUF1989 family)